MTFDTKKFLNEKFTHRTEDVPVPDLNEWYDEDVDEAPVWTVRGLEGKEIGQTKEAAAKNKSIAGIMEMLQSSKVADKTDALKAMFDMGEGRTTENIAERLEQMVLGSVTPECSLELALKVCQRHPVDFFNITNEILKLTGLGMMPGKPKKSTKKQTSD